MISNLVYAVSLALVFNCVISVAKNSEEKAVIPSVNVTDHSKAPEISPIYMEGGPSENLPEKQQGKSRIVGRKGAIPPDGNMTQVIENIIDEPSKVPVATSTNSTALNLNSTTVSTISASINNVTVSAVSATTTTTTTVKPQSASTTTMKATTRLTTKKLIKKPRITESADDNPEILASEKNINYNTSKLEDLSVPKTSSDTDRTIVDDEKSTRRNYILYMGLAFALPVAFTLMHVAYKKVKNYMEVRHYQRVVSSLNI